VGGLHRARRLEELTAPVIVAALNDAKIPPRRVEELVLGNATAGSNPARLVALAGGLPEAASALSVDRQGASGLDAILIALRNVSAGVADVAVAGGAESLSTAPWRIARPRSLYHLPRFLDLEPGGAKASGEPQALDGEERLAKDLGISRPTQDAYALKAHLRATRAREARRLVGEIVPLRANVDEARDQSAVEPDLAALERLQPFRQPDGTLTPGNTSALHDGAAIAVVVSEAVWSELGRPPALRLLASVALGVPPEEEASAPIAAMQALSGRVGANRGPCPGPRLGAIELAESSAAQAIALADGLDLDEEVLNSDGGSLVWGYPLGAAGAVLVARLFTRLVRARGPQGAAGAVALGAGGGLGLAAAFERV
jgi:acetyl-CoA C-acetyltransferase